MITLYQQSWAWEGLAMEGHTLGVYPKERDWIYLRDTRWQNWRKRTIVCTLYTLHTYTKNPFPDFRFHAHFLIVSFFFSPHSFVGKI